MQIKHFLKILETIAPLNLASEWDTVGLQIEPDPQSKVNKVLLTLDLTEPVLEEAISKQADFILSYHPLLFEPVPRLTQDHRIARISMGCLKHQITVYSPHTALDAVRGGMTDWLTSLAGKGDTTIIEPNEHDPEQGHGRYLRLESKTSISSIAETMKDALNLPYVRTATSAVKGHNIQTIAVCPGAGASLILGTDADLLITGEMRHHDLLTAMGEGKSVILLEHAQSERGYFPIYVEKIKEVLSNNSIEFILSEVDRGPLTLQL